MRVCFVTIDFLLWAKDAIATAPALGIVNGYNEDLFAPDELITREQVSSIIVRAAVIAAADKSTSFKDSSDISQWAQAALTAAAAEGIMNGYSDGTVKPKNNTTRAEAVVIVLRALQN